MSGIDGKVWTRLQDEVYSSEAYLTGLFWSDPKQFEYFSEEKLNYETFLNPVWGFYFSLGRYMKGEGIMRFDPHTVNIHIEKLDRFRPEGNFKATFEKYGGCQYIMEAMEEVRELSDNLNSYYENVVKYSLIKDIMLEGHGERVVTNTEKYNYHVMTADQIHTYWVDRLNKLAIKGDSGFESHDLLSEFNEDWVDELDQNPDIGMEYYDSPLLSNISKGWARGNVYINATFSGKGKTAFLFNKVIMSAIIKKEKLLIIANEQSKEEFKKMLAITVMGVALRVTFERSRILEGGFTDEEKAKLKEAVKWVQEQIDGEKRLLEFVFMENYTIDNVKRCMTYFANRGYSHQIIDTGKPSEGRAGGMDRWERFAQDFVEIYKLAKENAGGLNIAVWVNVQLADAAVNRRFLDETCLGESKKIKNEASVVMLGRLMFPDEFAGEKNELLVYKQDGTESGLNRLEDVETGEIDERGNKKTRKVIRQYYLLFVSKNRRGLTNDGGLPVLVMTWNLNSNNWEEVGWTYVQRDGF